MQVLWAINMAERCSGGRPTSVAGIAHEPELEAVFVAMHTGELFIIHTEAQGIEEVRMGGRSMPSVRSLLKANTCIVAA